MAAEVCSEEGIASSLLPGLPGIAGFCAALHRLLYPVVFPGSWHQAPGVFISDRGNRALQRLTGGRLCLGAGHPETGSD